MANFLSFDVYDIDLSKVMNDSNLDFVLLQTTSIYHRCGSEDLDRFLTEKSTTVSLFVDVHIYFSFCEFFAFKTLANNYLGSKITNFSQVTMHIDYNVISLFLLLQRT
jgi:chaperone BCS1